MITPPIAPSRWLELPSCHTNGLNVTSKIRVGRFVMIAARFEKSTCSSARFALSAAFASCDAWTFFCRLSSEDAASTAGVASAMNTATIAISAKELNSFLRAVLNEACRAIATPAAIRNQPAYGRVATPIRQPATMIGNELRSPRFQRRAPPKATRPSARNIGDSLCRRLEKKIPLGSKASTQAAITAARAPASS